MSGQFNADSTGFATLQSMRRILVRKPGGHSALELVSEPDPRPGPGQILVRVAAAGVNFADAIVRMGYYTAAQGLYPLTPGFEFAGEVAALGPGAEGFRPGERVLGITRFGGYASHIAVDPWQLWPCPEGWELDECAALPAVYLTAYYALWRAAKIEPGEILLIHSAAGGVGTALLQLAAIEGCRVVAVVGAAHKTALCRRLGAQTVIDRSRENLWDSAERAAPAGFDAIFDAGGVSTLREGFNRLAPGGRLVVYGFADMLPRGKAPGLAGLALNYLRIPRFSPFDMTASNRGVVGFNVVFMFHKRELARGAMGEVLRWVAEGRVAKTPVASYPVEKTADAHRDLESGRTVGKLVLTF